MYVPIILGTLNRMQRSSVFTLVEPNKKIPLDTASKSFNCPVNRLKGAKHPAMFVALPREKLIEDGKGNKKTEDIRCNVQRKSLVVISHKVLHWLRRLGRDVLSSCILCIVEF